MRSDRHAAGLLLLAWTSVGATPDDSMTVTAYLSPQPLDRTGSTVSVIDRDTLLTRQAAVAADALRSVPGLAIARSGPVGAQTQVRMRGAEANQVLVLIDGVEANDLATADEFSFEHLTTFDIERIEVVRGPQSALWGSDALAGVINVVTRRPVRPFEADGFVEGGSHDFANAGLRAGVSGERGLLALSASRFVTDGTNVARSGSEDDGYDNTTLNLLGSLSVRPGLTLDMSARHTDSSTDFDRFAPVDGEYLPVDADSSTDARQTYLRGGARAAFRDGRWTHGLHYAVTDTSTETDADDGFGGRERSSVDGDRRGVYYQTSLSLGGSESDAADVLTLAADYETQDFSQRGDVLDFGEGLVFDPNQDRSMNQRGLAAEYLATLGPDLTLSASLRHDHYSDFDAVNTWRGTGSWNIRPFASRLHASMGTGLKTPTFTERFGVYPTQFVGNPDLEPERSRGWDAGIERSWRDGEVVADLTYFRARLDDEINGLYCATGRCTAINESGTSRRAGVELTVSAEFSRSVALSGAYTYTDATEPDQDAGGSQSRELRRPRHSGSVDLTGRWLEERLVVSVGAAYTGEREDVVALDTFEAPFTRRATLGAYTLVRLAASYDLPHGLAVYGRVDNVLDEEYEDVYGFSTPGITAYLGLRAALGR